MKHFYLWRTKRFGILRRVNTFFLCSLITRELQRRKREARVTSWSLGIQSTGSLMAGTEASGLKHEY